MKRLLRRHGRCIDWKKDQFGTKRFTIPEAWLNEIEGRRQEKKNYLYKKCLKIGISSNPGK